MTALRAMAARIRLALLCAALAAAGGAPPARALVEGPPTAEVVLVERAHAAPTPRAPAEVTRRVPGASRPRLALARAPRPPDPAAAGPLYLAHHALLR